jgi:large subunit ribosomal protein L23
MNQERLMQVLLAPIVSEKSTFIAEKNEQVAFRVIQCATKPEIKAAVELLFKVEVEAVRVINRKGKTKRTGRGLGRRSNTRLAYVALKKGQEIHFDEEVK